MGKNTCRRPAYKRRAESPNRPNKFIKDNLEQKKNANTNRPAEDKHDSHGKKEQVQHFELLEGLSNKWDYLRVRKQSALAIGYINLQGLGNQKKKHISKVVKGMHQDIFLTTEHHKKNNLEENSPNKTVKDLSLIHI